MGVYLILSDSLKFKHRTAEYFVCSNQYLPAVLKTSPAIKSLQLSEIDGLLLYALHPQCAEQRAIKTVCSSLTMHRDSLKIGYGAQTELPITCKNIKDNLYRWLRRQGRLTDKGLLPAVVLVDNQEINQLLIRENRQQKNQIRLVNDLKQQRQWREIVAYLNRPDRHEETWRNLPLLNELIFALSKLVDPVYKINAAEKFQYEQLFLQATNQALKIEPQHQTVRGILAYHYYCVFIKTKSQSDYEKAHELYLWLIEHGTEHYKAQYRFWKLQKQHFELVKWHLGEKWLAEVNAILTGFQNLVQSYQQFPPDKQKKYRKEYLKSMYNYGVFALENLFQYWDAFVNQQLFHKPLPAYLFTPQKMQMIATVDEYLTTLQKLQQFEKITPVAALSQKPNYLDVLYRQAQIEQVKGLVYRMKQTDPTTAQRYFVQSNQYLQRLFAFATMHKNQTYFLFPNYAKGTQAINDYFLNSPNWEQNFSHAKPYLLYQQAVMNCLQNRNTQALRILNTIPRHDKIYHKAQTLRQFLTSPAKS